jgi:hypothetical protein
MDVELVFKEQHQFHIQGGGGFHISGDGGGETVQALTLPVFQSKLSGRRGQQLYGAGRAGGEAGHGIGRDWNS